MFVSYAQNFEDVMLRRALRDVANGFYIDAGASFPVEDSVTKAFYEAGWNGINIEPAAKPFAQLAADRPRDVNINAGLGERPETAKFYLINGGNGLSTQLPDFAQGHEAAGWQVQETTLEIVTLASVCEAHAPADIHFLKIDVEGAEASALKGADFNRFRPWIILIEATKPNTQIPTHQEWEPLLLAAGYEFAYFDGLNRFYLAAERADSLHPAFAAPPNVFDGFIRFAEYQAKRDAARLQAQLTARKSPRRPKRRR